MNEDIRTARTRVAYANQWMTVHEDEIIRADGSCGLYSYVEKPDFALIIPLEGAGVWLVEQYRYPVRRRSWEFPQGTFPPGTEGSAEELARAELVEETGFRAGSLIWIGRLDCAHGMSSQGFDVWLARELIPGEPRREHEEQDMRQRWFSMAELEQMIRAGTVTDSVSVAAYALLNLT
jgi:8-oxo-dGTP pyrophosphatase MutT (NUDIX family)